MSMFRKESSIEKHDVHFFWLMERATTMLEKSVDLITMPGFVGYDIVLEPPIDNEALIM